VYVLYLVGYNYAIEIQLTYDRLRKLHIFIIMSQNILSFLQKMFRQAYLCVKGQLHNTLQFSYS